VRKGKDFPGLKECLCAGKGQETEGLNPNSLRTIKSRPKGEKRQAAWWKGGKEQGPKKKKKTQELSAGKNSPGRLLDLGEWSRG